MKRRGFTIIELLVVIGIIAVLASLLIMGVGKMQTSAKRRQTLQILENCRALYAEYDAAKRTAFPMQLDAGPLNNYPLPNTFMPCPRNVTAEGNLDRVPVTTNPGSDYASGKGVALTRDFMLLFKAMPNNAAALAKLPADALMYVPAANLPPATINPPVWGAGGNYLMGDRATLNGVVYACIQNDIAQAGPNPVYNGPPDPAKPSTASSTHWTVEPSNGVTIPIPLDGWGNPIIFVPGGALGVPNNGTFAATQALFVDQGSGSQSFMQKSPDNRPFFASAGPDGDFSKGDDNLYSFEK